MPVFPTDDQTLGLLHNALHPEAADRTSLDGLLRMLSDMLLQDGVCFHPKDVIDALLGAIRELRARLDTAHDALTRIDDGDDDSYTTLESTVDYVVRRYQAVATSEEQAADEIQRLRDELGAIADLAYRAGGGEATRDALAAIQSRAHKAAGGAR